MKFPVLHSGRIGTKAHAFFLKRVGCMFSPTGVNKSHEESDPDEDSSNRQQIETYSCCHSGHPTPSLLDTDRGTSFAEEYRRRHVAVRQETARLPISKINYFSHREDALFIAKKGYSCMTLNLLICNEQPRDMQRLNLYS